MPCAVFDGLVHSRLMIRLECSTNQYTIIMITMKILGDCLQDYF